MLLFGFTSDAKTIQSIDVVSQVIFLSTGPVVPCMADGLPGQILWHVLRLPVADDFTCKDTVEGGAVLAKLRSACNFSSHFDTC